MNSSGQNPLMTWKDCKVAYAEFAGCTIATRGQLIEAQKAGLDDCAWGYIRLDEWNLETGNSVLTPAETVANPSFCALPQQAVTACGAGAGPNIISVSSPNNITRAVYLYGNKPPTENFAGRLTGSPYIVRSWSPTKWSRFS